MMITTPASRAAARRLVGEYVLAASIGVAAVFVFSLVVTFGVATVAGPIEVSGWSYGSSTLVKWVLLVVGFATSAVTLPEHIAHGRTRREFFAQQAVCSAVLALVVGVAYTVGYALEGVVYGLMDWPQMVSDSGLYDAADQYPLIAVENWLTLPTWIVVGTLVGAGFYRSGALGIALVPVCAVLVTVVESAVATRAFGLPLLGDALADLDAWSAPLPMVLTCVGVALLGLALNWTVVRDIPLRPRPH